MSLKEPLPISEIPEKDMPDADDQFIIDTAEGPRKTKMESIYERMESSYLGIITPSSTIPTTGSWYGTVLESGTFNNVSPAITVTAADLDIQNGTANNEVRIIISEGVATKDVRRVKGDKGDNGLGNVTLKSPSYDALPDKSLLIDEGTFITSKSANATYPNEGVISSSTGAYTATTGRKATDFIDVTGYTHILQNALYINSIIGTAFYDASNVFISGAVNTGSPQLLAIPAGTKYVRTSGYLGDATAYLYLVNILETEANTLSFWRDGVLTEMKITPEALQFAGNIAGENLVAYKEGEYVLKETQHPKPNISEYVQYGSGDSAASANYRRTEKIPKGTDTHLEITGLTTATTNNNITFYKEDSSYLGYLSGKSTDATTTELYAIPTGAFYWQISTQNANISTFNLISQRRQTVEANQLMFYENDTVEIFTGGSGSVPISGSELIADLPVSDGTAQASGDAYIDSATRTVKVKA